MRFGNKESAVQAYRRRFGHLSSLLESRVTEVGEAYGPDPDLVCPSCLARGEVVERDWYRVCKTCSTVEQMDVPLADGSVLNVLLVFERAGQEKPDVGDRVRYRVRIVVLNPDIPEAWFGNRAPLCGDAMNILWGESVGYIPPDATGFKRNARERVLFGLGDTWSEALEAAREAVAEGFAPFIGAVEARKRALASADWETDEVTEEEAEDDE